MNNIHDMLPASPNVTPEKRYENNPPTSNKPKNENILFLQYVIFVSDIRLKTQFTKAKNRIKEAIISQEPVGLSDSASTDCRSLYTAINKTIKIRIIKA